MTPVQAVLFALLSVPILVLSRKVLLRPRLHGFYRTWAWEAILALFLLNVDSWFVDPLAWNQLAAWTLLVASLVVILCAVLQLRRQGGQDRGRRDEALIGIEKTARLVTTGLYGTLRHPFYASLLYLAWGIFFKRPGWAALALAASASAFLVATALIEEREDIAFFGPAYREYMRHTKRFIPFVF